MNSAAATPPDRSSGLIGQVLSGRYRVDRVIGEGGMAVVYRGRHLALDRAVAIKVLRPEVHLITQLVERFQREARVASNLEHPNCVPVFDCGSTPQDHLFLVMPYLEGVELARLISTPFAPSQAVALTLQMLQGLRYIHRCGVIHRDLKPENIFVVRSPEGGELLKICDFGISKLQEESVTSDEIHTKFGTVMGTPCFMSPEQAMGLDVDARSDLYSLGIIFYQLLVARLPYDVNEPRELLAMHQRVPVPPIPSSIPSAVRAAAHRFLALDPGHRYQSCDEAIAALEQLSAMLATDPQPWRPLLDTPSARADERPSIPSLGGGTLVASPTVERASVNRPPSERSGVEALPTIEQLEGLDSGTFTDAPLDQVNAVLGQIIDADATEADLMTSLLGDLAGGDASEPEPVAESSVRSPEPPKRGERAPQLVSLVPELGFGEI